MQPAQKEINVRATIQAVKSYVRGEVYTGKKKLDYNRVHRYLTDLVPYADEPDASLELLNIVALLYYEETRYQEAARLLRRANKPDNNRSLEYTDFYNGYYVSVNSWKERQKRVWSAFFAREEKLIKTSPNNPKRLTELVREWESCFPTQELMVVSPADGRKGEISLGAPDGIFSLYPMQFLTTHTPWKAAENWTVLVEPTAGAPETCLILGNPVPAGEIRLTVHPYEDGKVLLAVYHPSLTQAVRAGRAQEASQSAISSVNRFLPLSARLLYVAHVVPADGEPQSNAFPLPELTAQLEARGMDLHIPADQVLERRRRPYTREPIRCTRPRTDIIRGETCMPELEEMYFLRREEYLNTLQRYGVGGWFLTFPKKFCGEDFQAFRKDLEERIARVMGDTVYFTGWAEGTKNCYLDFLAADGQEALEAIASDRQWGKKNSKNVQCCTFYWNSALRSVSCGKEMLLSAQADTANPSKELVTERQRIAMEKYFRSTVWGDMAGVPKPQMEDAPYEGDLFLVQTPVEQTQEKMGEPAAVPEVPPVSDAAESAELDPSEDDGNTQEDQASAPSAGKSPAPRQARDAKGKGSGKKKNKHKKKKK